MSYAFDKHLPGSESRRSSCPSFGAVKGWWRAFHLLFSSSKSNMGKSTIHKGAQTKSFTRPLSCPIFSLKAPNASLTTFSLSAPKKIKSPLDALVLSMIAFNASGLIFFTIGL